MSKLQSHAAPLILGLGLWAFNSSPLLFAYLHPPAGYVGALLPQQMDFWQYQTWMNAYHTTNAWLLPDYHAPWSTEPALLNPMCLFIGRTSAILGIDAVWVYHFLNLAFSIAGGYALLFALRVFTESRRQARLALLVLCCCVPVASIFALITYAFGTANPWLHLLWLSARIHSRFDADAFVNGISGGPLVLFGTVTTILSMALLAAYLKTNAPKFLRWAGLIAGISAFGHPFEVFAIVGGGGLALLLRRGRPWSQSVRDAMWLAIPGAIGVAPYLYLDYRHAWFRQAAQQNRWEPFTVPVMVLILGFPTLLCLLSFFLPLGKASITDRLLSCWFLTVLFGEYLPWLPWSHHMLDGFYYAAALLLVRQAARWDALRRLAATRPRLLAIPLSLLLLACLTVRAITWREAMTAAREPGAEGSALVSTADRGLVLWLRNHAKDSDLILAPRAAAGLLATTPMHSFGSHWLFSLTWSDQLIQAYNFYRGAMDGPTAAAFLDRFGFRYILIPEGSAAAQYVTGRTPVARIESITIYEIPNAQMRPYTSARD